MSADELLARAQRDSLDGTFSIAGFLAGSLADSFTRARPSSVSDLVRGADGAVRLAGGFDIGGLPKAPSGTLWMRLDSVRIAGIGIDTVHALLAMHRADSGVITFGRLHRARRRHDARRRPRLVHHRARHDARSRSTTLRLVTGGPGGHTWQSAAAGALRSAILAAISSTHSS